MIIESSRCAAPWMRLKSSRSCASPRASAFSVRDFAVDDDGVERRAQFTGSWSRGTLATLACRRWRAAPDPWKARFQLNVRGARFSSRICARHCLGPCLLPSSFAGLSAPRRARISSARPTALNGAAAVDQERSPRARRRIRPPSPWPASSSSGLRLQVRLDRLRLSARSACATSLSIVAQFAHAGVEARHLIVPARP